MGELRRRILNANEIPAPRVEAAALVMRDRYAQRDAALTRWRERDVDRLDVDADGV